MTVEEAKDYLSGIRDLKMDIVHIREQRKEVELGRYLSGIDYTKVKVQTAHKDPKAAAIDELARLQDLEVETVIAFIERATEAFRIMGGIFDSRLRMVLQLYFMDGLTMKEVAKELEYSERAVYRYYRQALTEYAEIATETEKYKNGKN